MNHLDTNTALVRLNEFIDKVDEFKSYGTDEHFEFYKWRNSVLNLIERQNGKESKEYKDFAAIDFSRAQEELLYQINIGVKFNAAISRAESLLHGIKKMWESNQKTPDEKNVRVFISHSASDDADIANAFRQWLISTYSLKQEEVFVSSSPDSIGGNNFAMAQIGLAVRSASAVIILLTKKSVKKTWVAFEAGVGFGTRRLLSPILCKGMTVSDIPKRNPFQHLQAKDAAKQCQFVATLNDLDKMLDVKPGIRPDDGECLRQKLIQQPKG